MRPPSPATAEKRARVDYNDAAKAFFESSLPGWRAAAGVERARMAKQLFATAQAPEMAARFESEKWSVVKVASAMNNLLRRANKVARAEARRAEAQATAA